MYIRETTAEERRAIENAVDYAFLKVEQAGKLLYAVLFLMQSPLSAFKHFARRNHDRAEKASSRKNNGSNHNQHNTSTPLKVLDSLSGQLFPPFSHADNIRWVNCGAADSAASGTIGRHAF